MTGGTPISGEPHIMNPSYCSPPPKSTGLFPAKILRAFRMFYWPSIGRSVQKRLLLIEKSPWWSHEVRWWWILGAPMIHGSMGHQNYETWARKSFSNSYFSWGIIGGWATPLKKISQLGWLFPIYGKIENGNQTTNQWDIPGNEFSTLGYLASIQSSHTGEFVWAVRACACHQKK